MTRNADDHTHHEEPDDRPTDPGTDRQRATAAHTPTSESSQEDDSHPVSSSPSRIAPLRELVLGAAFGIAFGFLLQKGGVAKYHILMGVLLLEDFTVIKVMGSAVIVGMILVAILSRFELIELQFKPTWIGANVVGGLIFGLGFGMSGYCPGTASAALGQGNFDALATMGGLLIGSLIFAEISGTVERTVRQWGHLGEFSLPDAARMSRLPFAIGFAALLASLLFVIELLL